jgi:hypothetical protein
LPIGAAFGKFATETWAKAGGKAKTTTAKIETKIEERFASLEVDSLEIMDSS